MTTRMQMFFYFYKPIDLSCINAHAINEGNDVNMIKGRLEKCERLQVPEGSGERERMHDYKCAIIGVWFRYMVNTEMPRQVTGGK